MEWNRHPEKACMNEYAQSINIRQAENDELIGHRKNERKRKRANSNKQTNEPKTTILT